MIIGGGPNARRLVDEVEGATGIMFLLLLTATKPVAGITAPYPLSKATRAIDLYDVMMAVFTCASRR
jgi:hypothetical protein